jgi:hypothetical protein
MRAAHAGGRRRRLGSGDDSLGEVSYGRRARRMTHYDHAYPSCPSLRQWRAQFQLELIHTTLHSTALSALLPAGAMW